MIKVCLDSNIIISALLFDGKPEEILLMGSGGDIEIVVSPAILDEIKKNVNKKFNRSEADSKKLIKNITSISKLINPQVKINIINYSPDNRILETAVEGNADYIITGDKKHLLPLKEFKDIPIVTPAQFLNTLK